MSNQSFEHLILPVKKQLAEYKARGKRYFATSSFQTHSIPMLHMLISLDRNLPVYFLDTGFHFPETVLFRNEVARFLGIEVHSVQSPVPRSHQRNEYNQFYFTSDPDHCCYLNKTLPTEELLKTHDVWINGVRRDQSSIRKAFQTEQAAPHGALRYHPMLEWTRQDIYAYIRQYNLPRHPLDAKGITSVGCEPCTRRMAPMGDNERASRWFGMKKTECGLHTDLALPTKP